MEEIRKDMTALSVKVDKIDSDVQEMKGSLVATIERHTQVMQQIGERMTMAMEIQGNSLSVPLLKDVLIPLMMKVFTFFSGIVLLLLTAILGIRWAFSDVLRALGMH